MIRPSRTPTLETIGWREWVSLPEFGVPLIKVKVDTGARSSSLHAFGLEVVRRRGRDIARFVVHPLQRDSTIERPVEAEVVEYRHVRSSNGSQNERPVVITEVAWGPIRWPVEVTLANRDEMGFRMLLGRQAVRGRFLVDPHRSFYAGDPNPGPHDYPKPIRRKR